MFSRGNAKEKARILSLDSVRTTVEGSQNGCTAVDLYAGIGYFAFCYRKAGVRCVLGWELSPWSVEGLRRGAAMNGWRAKILEGAEDSVADGDCVSSKPVNDGEGAMPDFIVFREDNRNAATRMRALRRTIPPVRHVNCGLLPSSRGSWDTALRMLDPSEGGWLHLHENIAIGEIDEQAHAILAEVQGIADSLVETGDFGRAGTAGHVQKSKSIILELEHVEKVKTYAPGVMHCVLDVFVPTGTKSAE